MSRSKLPQRRANVTEWIWWPPPPENATKRIHITAGLVMDAAGALKVKECFIRGGSKVGHERDTLYDDLAVLLSRALQHGDTLEEIAAGLSGRNVASDLYPQGAPASVIGAVVDCLIGIEKGLAASPLPAPKRTIRLSPGDAARLKARPID